MVGPWGQVPLERLQLRLAEPWTVLMAKVWGAPVAGRVRGTEWSPERGGIQDLLQNGRRGVEAGVSAVAAGDAGEGFDCVVGIRSRPQVVGDDPGEAVEDGGAATPGLAEAGEDLEGRPSVS